MGMRRYERLPSLGITGLDPASSSPPSPVLAVLPSQESVARGVVAVLGSKAFAPRSDLPVRLAHHTCWDGPIAMVYIV